MDLEVIAQIITGTATLIVAMVLLYQLRQQHKDSEIQISMMSESLNERLFNFGHFDKEYYQYHVEYSLPVFPENILLNLPSSMISLKFSDSYFLRSSNISFHSTGVIFL